MRAALWLAAVVALLAAGTVAVLLSLPEPDAPARNLAGLEGNVERGAYVARLSGCIGCHSDSKSGRGVLAGGAGIETDFGTFFAPNITPHPEDGVGSWSLEDFSRALSEGRGPEGQHYFPSFPYPFYARLSDQELVDLWAAVRSVPAVAGGPPSHDLQFPFGFREGAGMWKRLFFDPGPLVPVAGQTTAWNRGRYLARGPGHCGACHTPRNLLGARDDGSRFAGGKGPGGEKIPPITPGALRAESWTADDLAYALKTGILPSGDVFGGSMAEVIRDGTRFWSDSDLAALTDYIMNSEADQ